METTAVNELPGGKPYFYYRLKKDFPIQSRQTHWRGYPQLVHLRDGMLEVWLNCQKYTLSAGDVLYIAAGTLISWQLMGAELDVLVFDPARFTRLPNSQDNSFFPRGSCLCIRDDNQALIACLHNFIGGLILSSRYFDNCVPDLRQIMLAYTEGAYTTLTPETPAFSARQLSHLKTVLQMIESHLCEQMTLDQLAAEIGLSSKYFCRFFQRMTGMTPFTYINVRRIEWACDLFIREKATVRDISERVGYRDINYFIKTFKRYCGMTPKRFSSHYFGAAEYLTQY